MHEKLKKAIAGILLCFVLISIGYAIGNAARSFVLAMTHAKLSDVPNTGSTARYSQHVNRYSAAFALASDFAMLTLGGDLKKRELLSARLGDILSSMYLASCVLKHFENQGRRATDLPLVVREPCGLGEVTFIAFDLAAPPLADWAGRPHLLRRLFTMLSEEDYESIETTSSGLTSLGYDDLTGQLRASLDVFPGIRGMAIQCY